MGTRYSSGFTIIETVLFLSVTGLLVMGVLIGTGTSINNQRYRDATQTIKNTVQEQYTALESVRNGRNNNWTCQPGTALPVQGGTEIRGQSSCVIVGRYMQIKSNEITIYSVLARKNNDLPSNTDIAALNANYVYGISTSEVVSKTMEWGTEIAWPQSGSGARADTTPRNIAILFVRSPESGAVYTFTSDDVPPFNDIINPGGIKSMISTSSQVSVRFVLR